jgi:lysophospholipase L1-like esterase
MVNKKTKKVLISAAILIALFIGAEVYMRCYWGFCDTVLTQSSDKFEYLAQPNQDHFRFRKHIHYNEYGMRSKSPQSTDKIRILGFGDSVLNGGVQTEQDSLATSIIEKKLKQDSVRCLNISYGSWGPDNAYAFMQQYGDFEAVAIFLVFSSHDAYDNMDFQPIVDIHPSFPSKQYKSAVWELVDRYLIPRLLKKEPEEDHIVKGQIFNSGFESFYSYTQEKNIPFFIYLHPDRKELENGYYEDSGQEIIKFCNERNIPLILGMDVENANCFRDVIHLNEHGQAILANALLAEIEKYTL